MFLGPKMSWFLLFEHFLDIAAIRSVLLFWILRIWMNESFFTTDQGSVLGYVCSYFEAIIGLEIMGFTFWKLVLPDRKSVV